MRTPPKRKRTRRALPPRQWQFQEAKAKLAEVVDDALATGPQVISRHGRPVVAMIKIEDLPKVLAAGQDARDRAGSILACFKRAPQALGSIDLSRDKTPISSKSIFG
jgi:prevent-host-death family protein